jgi:hypothetical protein
MSVSAMSRFGAGVIAGGGVVLRHLWLLVQALVLLLMVLLASTLMRRACPSLKPWITGPLSTHGDRLVDGVVDLVKAGGQPGITLVVPAAGSGSETGH